MRARTNLCAVALSGAALLSFTGCGGSGSPNPTPTTTPAIHNQWTWEGGANVAGQGGIYGTQGTAVPNNIPGAREHAIGWTDASGDFWLFGGDGYDSTVLTNLFGGSNTNVIEIGNYLNDLWKYSGGQWTWMGGSNLANQPGVYGTQGAAAPGNIPGPRHSSASWIDPSGGLWLFGGATYTVIGNITYLSTISRLNDLWKYSAGQWTWMGGSSTTNQPGSYGTLGLAAPGNVPGARLQAASWTDPSGTFWLFGGSAVDSAGTIGFLNDLWKYSVGQWTWMGGPNVVAGQPAEYGTLGMAASGNIPGPRARAFSWTDPSGNLWLFGGDGYDSQANYGSLSDLWKYSAGQWTWVNGSNLANQSPVYGTEGTAAPANSPGSRNGGVSWVDASGGLWLFGGARYNSTGPVSYFNDVWRYSTGQWTWMGGSNQVDEAGTYGAEGTAAPADVPGGRYHAASWADASGNLWLFGGNTPESDPTALRLGIQNYRNDLWMYQP